MQVFFIVVDNRDTLKLSKLTESYEWKLHSKYLKIFNKIKNNDLILFSKESNYSWDAVLELKEKHTLEIKNNSHSEFREKNKTLALEFKDKNLLSKYQNLFDVPNLSKTKPGLSFLKTVSSVKNKTKITLNSLTEDQMTTISSLSGVQEFPMRVKCATMAWHTLLSAVEKK